MDGAVAQLVEQWTENPCVAGSTPAHTTALKTLSVMMGSFAFSDRSQVRYAHGSGNGLKIHLSTEEFSLIAALGNKAGRQPPAFPDGYTICVLRTLDNHER